MFTYFDVLFVFIWFHLRLKKAMLIDWCWNLKPCESRLHCCWSLNDVLKSLTLRKHRSIILFVESTSIQQQLLTERYAMVKWRIPSTRNLQIMKNWTQNFLVGGRDYCRNLMVNCNKKLSEMSIADASLRFNSCCGGKQCK